MILAILIVIGVVLVGVGVVALFKLKGQDSDTSFGFGSVKITTKSPALAVILIGVLCIAATRFVPAPSQTLPAAVVASYLDLIATYNRGDAAGYYAHFAERMECFYAAPNVRIKDERAELSSHLQVSAADLEALDVQPNRVELCDRGHWLDKKNALRQHHKLIVLKKMDGAWRVVTETSADENHCYASPYGSKC